VVLEGPGAPEGGPLVVDGNSGRCHARAQGVVAAATNPCGALSFLDAVEVDKKGVVFDFDQCLMKGHWWGDHGNAPLEGIDPQRGDFGHSNIGWLLRRLLSLGGVTVAIASFGRHDVIKKALRAVLPEALAVGVHEHTPHPLSGPKTCRAFVFIFTDCT